MTSTQIAAGGGQSFCGWPLVCGGIGRARTASRRRAHGLLSLLVARRAPILLCGLFLRGLFLRGL
eukprot:11201496-Lingulodinium_polyedra.AAC.1